MGRFSAQLLEPNRPSGRLLVRGLKQTRRSVLGAALDRVSPSSMDNPPRAEPAAAGLSCKNFGQCRASQTANSPVPRKGVDDFGLIPFLRMMIAMNLPLIRAETALSPRQAPAARGPWAEPAVG
jgi:hypothetical protein